MLKRLEAVKEQIDPNYIFDCNQCIGNNRILSLNESTTTTEGEGGGANQETKNGADRRHFLSLPHIIFYAHVYVVVVKLESLFSMSSS